MFCLDYDCHLFLQKESLLIACYPLPCLNNTSHFNSKMLWTLFLKCSLSLTVKKMLCKTRVPGTYSTLSLKISFNMFKSKFKPVDNAYFSTPMPTQTINTSLKVLSDQDLLHSLLDCLQRSPFLSL